MKQIKTENQETTTTKQKSKKLYIGIIQDEFGKIQKVFTGADYNNVWLLCATESKAVAGFWEIRDFQGREIDSNFRSQIAK